MSQQSNKTIVTWLRERDEARMMNTFAVLAEQHGLESLRSWRFEGTKHEHTILHELVKKCSVKVIKFLVERHGFDLNVQRSSDLCTPLHLAQYSDQKDLVQQLITLGADPSLKNRYGEDVHQTALAAKTMSAKLQGCKAVRDILDLLGKDFDEFSDTDLMHAYTLLGLKTADYDVVLCNFSAMEQQKEIRKSPAFQKLSTALQKLVVGPSASEDGSIWDTVLRAMIKFKDASILEAMACGATGVSGTGGNNPFRPTEKATPTPTVTFNAWSGVHLVHCVWGLTKLKANMQRWTPCFRLLLDLLVDKFDGLAQAELSQIMWTLGELRFQHDQVLFATSQSILSLGEDASAQTLCMAVWAHARTGSTSVMVDKLAEPIISGIPTFPHLDITLIAWSFAKLNMPREDLFSALFKRASTTFYEESSRHHCKVTSVEKVIQWSQIYYAYKFCCSKCHESLRSLRGKLAKDLRGIDDYRSGVSSATFSQGSGLSGRSLEELDRLIASMEKCREENNKQWHFEDSMEPALEEGSGGTVTKANAAMSAKLLGMAPEPLARFILLEFSRDPESFHTALLLGPELAGLRDDLNAHGLSMKHSSGAKICVRPEDYQLALDAVAFQSLELKPRHVLTTAEVENSILDAITSSCRSRERVTLKSKSENVWLLSYKTFGYMYHAAKASSLPVPDDEVLTESALRASEDEVAVRVERTFINVSVPNSLCSSKPHRLVKSA